MSWSQLASIDDDGGRTSGPPPFLETHRAATAVAHELERLSLAIARTATTTEFAGLEKPPATRRSPNRCIVQAGPVALTVTWLQPAHGTVATGELLAIVWHGAVFPAMEHAFDRTPVRRRAAPPTQEWEEIFVAIAGSADDWMWRPKGAESGALASDALAERWLSRLAASFATHAEEARLADEG